MPVLAESARSIAARAALAIPQRSVRIVVRAPGRPDVRIDTGGGGHAELGGRDALDGDAVVVTDPANRLLILWGRRSTRRTSEIDGPPDVTDALAAILWPNARLWPPL
jgi:hypothetical protein